MVSRACFFHYLDYLAFLIRRFQIFRSTINQNTPKAASIITKRISGCFVLPNILGQSPTISIVERKVKIARILIRRYGRASRYLRTRLP